MTQAVHGRPNNGDWLRRGTARKTWKSTRGQRRCLSPFFGRQVPEGSPENGDRHRRWPSGNSRLWANIRGGASPPFLAAVYSLSHHEGASPQSMKVVNGYFRRSINVTRDRKST